MADAAMNQESEHIKAHCNTCFGHTTHFILYECNKTWSEEETPISGGDKYRFLRCAGCGSLRLKHDNWFSEDTDDYGEQNVTTDYYPPAIWRRRPIWLRDPEGPFIFGNTEIEKLLEEIYSALQTDSRRLATMGIRALLESIMIEQVGDTGQIGTNVDRFLDQGFVPKLNHEMFRFQLIEAGHAAMHRQYVPEKADIDVLMQITESLIETIYVHPTKAKRLGKIPSRGKKNSPS
jgi:Domain of unknown function (DUF4145)